MRVQFTLKPTTMEALTQRAEAVELTVSRVVEHVLSQWLLRNEPLVFSAKAALVSDVTPSVSASTPSVSQNAPKPKKPCKVDTENFRVALGEVCGQEIKLEDIDAAGFHRNCPGTWMPG